MKFKTSCDMGSIKIFNKDLACFFSNDFGDGGNIVEIDTRGKRDTSSMKFIEHFTVKTKAYLSDYDCGENKIYTFEKGRYFVYLKKPTHFIIQKVDEYVTG